MASLDQYDVKPPQMINYLAYNGWHFSKRMCDFAISKMLKGGKPLPITTKAAIDEALKKNSIVINNNQLYDYVYVYHMAKADFFGTSLINEAQLLRFVKDYVDDEDAYDGMPFSRFYVDTVKKGIPLDWEGLL